MSVIVDQCYYSAEILTFLMFLFHIPEIHIDRANHKRFKKGCERPLEMLQRQKHQQVEISHKEEKV
jgi:hypothetical protein